MINIDTILSEISDLSLDDKEIIENILQKRIIEEKRNGIYKDFKEALNDYNTGNYKEGSIDDLFKRI